MSISNGGPSSEGPLLFLTSLETYLCARITLKNVKTKGKLEKGKLMETVNRSGGKKKWIGGAQMNFRAENYPV